MALKRFCDKCDKEIKSDITYAEFDVWWFNTHITSKVQYSTVVLCPDCMEDVFDFIKKGKE